MADKACESSSSTQKEDATKQSKKGYTNELA